MIIVGYQGIGKSTIARNGSGYIDLESGNFFVDGKRAEDWYIPYCNIAVHLSEQGYNVFVSSHAVVREELHGSSVQKAIVFPSLSLKDRWLKRLRERWERSRSEKDYRAYMNAVERYDENIRELMNADGFDPIVIENMGYDLGEMIEKYKGVN